MLSFLGLCCLQVVNPHLLKDLTERGLWNEEMKNQIIAHNGSIQVCVEARGGWGCLQCEQCWGGGTAGSRSDTVILRSAVCE